MALYRYVSIGCLVGLVGLTLPACTQDEDEPCQVDSDCGDGLVCSIATAALRGTCLPSGQVMQESDAGDGDGDETVDPDASVRDGSMDDDAG